MTSFCAQDHCRNLLWHSAIMRQLSTSGQFPTLPHSETKERKEYLLQVLMVQIKTRLLKLQPRLKSTQVAILSTN